MSLRPLKRVKIVDLDYTASFAQLRNYHTAGHFDVTIRTGAEHRQCAYSPVSRRPNDMISGAQRNRPPSRASTKAERRVSRAPEIIAIFTHGPWRGDCMSRLTRPPPPWWAIRARPPTTARARRASVLIRFGSDDVR